MEIQYNLVVDNFPISRNEFLINFKEA